MNKKSPFIARNGLLVPQGEVNFDGTEGMQVPIGTTAERLLVGLRNGAFRYNTDLNVFEGYLNGSWESINVGITPISHITNETLMVAGSIANEIIVTDAGNIYYWHIGLLKWTIISGGNKYLTLPLHTTYNITNGTMAYQTSDNSMYISNGITWVPYSSVLIFTNQAAMTAGGKDGIQCITTDSGNTYSWDAVTTKWRLDSGNIYASDPSGIVYDIQPGTIYNTTTGDIKVWNGTVWTAVGTGIGWEITNISKLADPGTGYFLDGTIGDIQITLPLTPSFGDSVGVSDYTGAAGSRVFQIMNNGSNIMGSLTNLTFTTPKSSIILMYTDASAGWVPIYDFNFLGDGIPIPIDADITAALGSINTMAITTKRTITLPNATSVGNKITISDVSGGTGEYGIQVNPSNNGSINGIGTIEINKHFGSVDFYATTTGGATEWITNGEIRDSRTPQGVKLTDITLVDTLSKTLYTNGLFRTKCDFMMIHNIDVVDRTFTLHKVSSAGTANNSNRFMKFTLEPSETLVLEKVVPIISGNGESIVIIPDVINMLTVQLYGNGRFEDHVDILADLTEYTAGTSTILNTPSNMTRLNITNTSIGDANVSLYKLSGAGVPAITDKFMTIVISESESLIYELCTPGIILEGTDTIMMYTDKTVTVQLSGSIN